MKVLLFEEDNLKYVDGRLYYIESTRGRQAGSRAGTSNGNGYRKIHVKGKRYYEHRYVYEKIKGTISEDMQVDHINRVRDDNRIENLRLVTSQENKFNSDRNGYSYNKLTGKYEAYITKDNIRKHIGLFDTEVEARMNYLLHKELIHTYRSTADA